MTPYQNQKWQLASKRAMRQITLTAPVTTSAGANRLSNIMYASGDHGHESGCFVVGISGGCGPDCYVYQEGDCPEPDGIEETTE